MIKAIIFDFFGVLTTESFRAFRKEYFATQPEKDVSAKVLMDRVNVGAITQATFFTSLASLAGLDEKTVKDYLSKTSVNNELLDYISAKLKPRYKLGIISNASGEWIFDILSKEQATLFDDTIVSYRLGVAKPDPQIYQASATNLEVKPSECVFIDDIEKYSKGAEAVGMKAIVYKDFDQMKADLEALL